MFCMAGNMKVRIRDRAAWILKLLVFTLWFLVLPVSSQTPDGGRGPTTETGPMARIETAIIGQKTCALGESVSLLIKLQLRITNTSDKTIVVQRDGFYVIGVEVKEKREGPEGRKVLWDSWASTVPNLIQLADRTPKNPLFYQIKVGETYTVERIQLVDLKIGDRVFLRSGMYLLDLSIRPWVGDSVLANELNQEWSAQNYFLMRKAMRADAIPLAIDDYSEAPSCEG